MSSTPSPGLPNSPLQSEKAKRYDRQLRLWGDHGQSALEGANVCLLNAGALGTEILKSLVLPGLGNFTILDPHDVKGEDAGNNFFLSADSIGQNRGEVAARLLLEMNHDVRGESRQETVDQVLASEPDFFSRFQLVVACDLSEQAVEYVNQTLTMPQFRSLKEEHIVTSCLGGAHESLRFKHENLDTIICNGVSMYFPSATYLLEVIQNADRKSVV